MDDTRSRIIAVIREYTRENDISDGEISQLWEAQGFETISDFLREGILMDGEEELDFQSGDEGIHISYWSDKIKKRIILESEARTYSVEGAEDFAQWLACYFEEARRIENALPKLTI